MNIKPFELFAQADTAEQMKKLQYEAQIGGYAFFRRILEGLQHTIKTFTDDEIDMMVHMLAKAKRYFPEPGMISPSWQTIWEELDDIVHHKCLILEKIPQAERDGEWQIVMDNPYTNQEVVCYPNLSFIEAAYLYAYFRPKLTKNEYIQVQKIQHQLTEYGS